LLNKSYLFCFIAVFFFSTNELVGKLIGVGISPTLITIVRFFLGSVLLLPFAWIESQKNPQKLRLTDIFNISYPGILNVAGAMLFLQLAIYYGKASTSAILISSNPIFVAIFAPFILKEKLSFWKIVGIISGILGVFLVVKGDPIGDETVINHFWGLYYGVLSSVTFGLYIVLAKKQVYRYGNYVFNSISFAAGAALLLAAALVFNFDLTLVKTTANISFLIYLGIFVTGAAYIFFFAGLKNIPAINGSLMFFFKPLIASFLAVILLRENITLLEIAGALLIFSGIYISNKN
jgi:drug/metabolite transporter (DMT)-like permease